MDKKDMKKPSAKKIGRMAALKGLHKMASDMMGQDMMGLKKVSVMAKDKKGLQQGLNKAKQLVGDEDGDEC